MRHTRPNQQLKGSVFDKIKIFENKNSKTEIIEENHEGLDLFNKNLKPLDCNKKTVVEALAEQKIGHTNKHEVEENLADDAISAFEGMMANCSLNLDEITDPFHVILEENKIVSQDCFDITISDISNFLI